MTNEQPIEVQAVDVGVRIDDTGTVEILNHGAAVLRIVPPDARPALGTPSRSDAQMALRVLATKIDLAVSRI
jgi:antitoxin (DNA-binding transcriptional repressor) of toxin-antitoxin stability system